MTTPTDQVRDPDFARRVRSSFDAQGAMRLFGARLALVEHGRVEIEMDSSPEFTQQHGFTHGGVIGAVLDTACGFAALTMMPPDTGVLTVEYKVNFLAPALGAHFRLVGRVRKAGRTITLSEADAYAVREGGEKLIATMTATLMTIVGRDDVRS
ncbi:MAG: PaaI family thioesterase [Burkholderiaceae bacterium]|nr:PaaI family thioesterase [Burkholderiaceae bacterium]